MAVGPETRLVGRIVKALAAAYPSCWTLKVHGGPYQRSGVPDLIAVVDGHPLAFEVKAPRPGESREALERRVTALQRKELADLTRAGARAAVVASVEEALALVKDCLENA